jgi:hypothetical protein
MMQMDVADMAMEDDLRANPLAMMLVAMLADQIQTLGYFRRRGMWRNDPAELGDWLRREAADPQNGRDTYVKEAAVREWQLWASSGADALIEVLARETMVVIDRGRIVRLAVGYAVADRTGDSRTGRVIRGRRGRSGARRGGRR